MTDRELLKLAAKAHGKISFDRFDLVSVFLEFREDGMHHWEPLTDDGDALRLAVKLEINILPTMEQASCRNPEYTAWTNEDASRDPCAATRRAIVRAAAEIGRVMS